MSSKSDITTRKAVLETTQNKPTRQARSLREKAIQKAAKTLPIAEITPKITSQERESNEDVVPCVAEESCSKQNLQQTLIQRDAATVSGAGLVSESANDMDELDVSSVDSETSTNYKKRVSLLYSSPRRGSGVEMDMATRVANDLLQKGKEALENAGNMKRECKVTAHEALQGLYETVLSLSDSRSRHKYNLEKERSRHAQELVRVERAHSRELQSIKTNLIAELCLARTDIVKTLKETQEVRSWLGYETTAPFHTIGKNNIILKTLEQFHKEEKVTRVGAKGHAEDPQQKDALLKELYNKLEQTQSGLSNQIDAMRHQLDNITKEVRDRKNPLGPHTPPPKSPPSKPSESISTAHLEKIEMDLDVLKSMSQSIVENTTKQQQTQIALKEDISKVLTPITTKMEELGSDLRTLRETYKEMATPPVNLHTEVAIAEVKESLQTIQKGVKELKNTPPTGVTTATPSTISTKQPKLTYVAAAAKPKPIHTPNHTLIVSSTDPNNTGEHVLEKIRVAVDTKTSGAKIDKIRKAKNQKVILSCETKDDLNLIYDKIKTNKGLKAEVAKSSNPLIIIRDVLSYLSDTDIVDNLKAQNKHLLQRVGESERTIKLRYRKRARNQLECHPVLEVSPAVHKTLLEAGKVYIGLQRRPVYDQSPLIQCTKCLGFGHTKAVCKEKDQLCSYCGGVHQWDKCKRRIEGESPTCKNCRNTEGADKDPPHHAFSTECRERAKWDAIARARVSYLC